MARFFTDLNFQKYFRSTKEVKLNLSQIHEITRQ